MAIRPFTIDVPDSVLDDLQRRLARTRWTAPIAGIEWEYGSNRAFMQSLLDHWQHRYDWRAQEATLNQLPQFKVEVDGLDIHFVHARGKGPNPRPLLLTHGWSDSFHRFHKVVPMLTDPARYGGDPTHSFDVVVPSLPGFAFSERPKERGMTTRRVGDMWVTLMRDVLGYERWGAVGGDLGTEVTLYQAINHPDVLTGIHLTDVSYSMERPEGVAETEDDQRYGEFIGNWFMTSSAYAMQQSTKPQTIAYQLNDSPLGLLSWLTEHFTHEGAKHSHDELITNAMIYWVTQTIASSMRYYYEAGQAYQQVWPAPHIDVPTAIAHFDGTLPPRTWIEHYLNVERWTDFDPAGHHPSLTAPEAFADDVRAFFSAH